MKLNAYFIPCLEGGYFAQIAEISNVFSQGETLEEARDNLLDALRVMTEHQRAKLSRQAESAGHHEEWEMATL